MGSMASFVDAGLVGAERATVAGNPIWLEVWRWSELGSISSKRPAAYSMNQPWLTMTDCPVNALDSKAARNKAASAISSTVVNW